ncbi:peptidoglycan recognition protein family protein [Leucobacter sp.]
MGFSPLAAMNRRIPDLGRSSPRTAKVSGFTIHHNAGVDALDQATAPGREVGANYWITNAGVIIPHVDEERRAFTSGHPGYPAGAASDHRNITVEVSNSPEGVRNGTWAISAAAQKALSQLIGDVFKRYRLGPVRRGVEAGVAVHRDFVPTECPGGFIMTNLARIIADAEQYRTEEEIMAISDADAKKIAAAVLDAKVAQEGSKKGGTTSLRKTIAWNDHQWASIKRVLEWIAKWGDKIRVKLGVK